MFSKNEIGGSYRIIRSLGEGGMAAVYEVEHVKLGVHYALKTFTLQEGHVELFRKRFSVFTKGYFPQMPQSQVNSRPCECEELGWDDGVAGDSAGL